MTNMVPLSILLILSLIIAQSSAFFNPAIHSHTSTSTFYKSKSTSLSVSSEQQHQHQHQESNQQSNSKDDEHLLKEVQTSQLQALCTQCNLSTEGTKEQLLYRLRHYAETQAKNDQEARRRRVERIEQGFDDTQGNGKAKHKVVAGDVDVDVDAGASQGSNKNDDTTEAEGSFYFSIPGTESKKDKHDSNNVKRSSTKIMNMNTDADVGTNTDTNTNTNMNINPQISPMNTITAPLPPPGVEPNEHGERVVTVYSTKDQNDLTGLANQNSISSASDAAMMGGYSSGTNGNANADAPENTLAGGPFGDQSGSQRKKASDKEYDTACDVISELVLSLVQMTGAPGFQDEFTDGVVPLEASSSSSSSTSSSSSSSTSTTSEKKNSLSSGTGAGAGMGDGDSKVNYNADFGFIGFDPSRVPTALITRTSKSLRVRNGDALQQVLNEFEMQAIGFDGMAGDDKDKGGGHYLEVQKVGTFLEGFRKAEVRRIARETSTMLLDKLVSEGVKGLDEMLIAMTKGSDDSSDSGELNDSLIKYLEDAVRQQEKKVEQLLGKEGVKECATNTLSGVEKGVLTDDLSDSFWNTTVGDNGEVIESFDPNDPEVKAALERELEIAKEKFSGRNRSMPTHPSQQLLILLTLLRERVKAEAMFSNDEKGRNLRILAYSLHAHNEQEREKVIMDTLGSSLDRLDSFSELLQSSIEYAESTAHLLQPSKSNPLNLQLLRQIKGIVDDLKEKQAWRASGISSQQRDAWQ